MKVYALWHGGPNYGLPEIPHDVEVFPSIAAAKQALLDRYFEGAHYRQHFEYAHRDAEDVFVPAVNAYGPGASSMLLYFADPSTSDDPYPDRVLGFGPRLGIDEWKA